MRLRDICCCIKKCLCVIVLLLFLAGCGGMGDWSYNALPAEYAIWRLNSQDIQLVKENQVSADTVVGRYVTAFCYNSRYVGIQRIPMDRSYSKEEDIDMLDKSNPEFYLIDCSTDSVTGPMTEQEYSSKIVEVGIQDMCQWIPTDPPPSDAKYE